MNEQLKNSFIDSFSSSEKMRSVARSLLSKVSESEEQLGKDLCFMTEQELFSTIEPLLGSTKRSNDNKVYIVKKYIGYCKVIGIKGVSDAIERFQPIGVAEIQNTFLANPADLQEQLDKMYDPESVGTLDNVFRCYCWMAYAGMLRDDILSLRTSDVDIDKMVVNANGKQYQIYSRALPCIKQCMFRDRFVSKHPSHKGGELARAEGDLLLRRLKVDNVSKSYTQTKIWERSKALAKTDVSVKKLSATQIWQSGLFYRLYLMEADGIPINFYEVAEMSLIEKKGVEHARSIKQSSKDRNARDFKHNYERWKMILHP